MSNEETQKTMQFILQQQAQFAADIQQLRESQKESVEFQAEVVKAQQRGEERIIQLENVVLRLVSIVEKMADTQAHTYQSQSETDERLNNLITVVERFISEGRMESSKAKANAAT
jgi:disulfide oxidoreductase YuzD